MRIFPRRFKLEKGVNRYELTIENSSDSDQVLLFRIRRSEQKLLTFSPKKGYVLSHEKKSITIYILDDKFDKTKLLVKAVVISKDELSNDFDTSWARGVQTTGGEVRKVIDLVNPEQALEGSKAVALSPGQEYQHNDTISEVSAGSGFDFSLDQSESTLHAPSLAALNTSGESKSSAIDLHSLLKKMNENYRSSQEDSTLKELRDVLEQYELRSQHVSHEGERESHEMLLKIAAYFLQLYKKDPAPNPIVSNISPVLTYSKLKERSEGGEREQEYSDELLEQYSALTPLPQSTQQAPIKCIVEVFGGLLKDNVIKQILQQRVCESIDRSGKIVAIEVQNTQMASLDQVIGPLFSLPDFSQDMSMSYLDTSAEPIKAMRELHTLRNAFLHDHLRSLSVSHCKLTILPSPSVNEYKALTSLHLNDNNIKVIEGELDLPSLRILDLSNNQLKTLDNLQLLINLNTLLAANNRLDSLEHSVTVLLPLADSLSALDLSQNVICSNSNYVDEALMTFINLKHFDTLDLSSFSSSYSNAHHYNRRSKPLPDFPCVQQKHCNSHVGTSSKGIEFEKRVRRALELRAGYLRKQRARSSHYSLLRTASQSQNEFQSVYGFQGEDNDNDNFPENLSTSDLNSNTLSCYKRESRKGTSSTPSAAKGAASASPSLSSVPARNTLPSPSFAPQASAPSNPAPASPSTSRLPTPLQQSSSPPRIFAQNSSSKQRRKSQAVSLLPHWAGHKEEKKEDKGGRRRKSFLDLTDSFKLRSQAFGMSSMNSNEDKHYFSDGDVSRAGSCRGRAEATLRSQNFEEMQETERYSIWHPRYRVPQPVFGYSKPFLRRSFPDQTGQIPLFEKTVQRIRDGFAKLPTRGTFTRASKGLTAEWYPMDYNDLEAIRRQGFFHETIGDIQRYSYRDLKHSDISNNSTTTKGTNNLASVSLSGSVTLSPSKVGRRPSIGQHMSRQYKHSISLNDSFISEAFPQQPVTSDVHESKANFSHEEAPRQQDDQNASTNGQGSDYGGQMGNATAPLAKRSASLANLFPSIDDGDQVSNAPSLILEKDDDNNTSKNKRNESVQLDKASKKNSARPSNEEDEDMATYLSWLESQYTTTHNLSLPLENIDSNGTTEEEERSKRRYSF